MNTQPSLRHRGPQTASFLLCLVAVIATGSVAPTANADDPSNLHEQLAKIAPLVDEQTIVVAKFDLAHLEVPDLNDVRQQPVDEERWRVWTSGATEQLESLRTATGGQTIYAILDMPHSWPDRPLMLFTEATDQVNQEVFVKHAKWFLPEAQLHEHDEWVIAVSGDRERAAITPDSRAAMPRQELEDAFQAVASSPIQILLLPPKHLRRTVQELMPQVPASWGGGPSKVWTEGVRWAAIGVDPGQMKAECVIQSASEQAVTSLENHVNTLLDEAVERIPSKPDEQDPWQSMLQPLRNQLTAERQDARWILSIEDATSYKVAAAMLFATLSGIQKHAGIESDTKKLKQILLAMHNYADTHKALPPREEDRDEQGRPYLSWRVHLLPFLDQTELYQQFRLDEPWDSPHNEPLIEKIPNVYNSSQWDVPEGHTTFLAPEGEDTIFGGDQATRFQDIHDGLSNTIAVVEVQSQLAVPWTAPDDYAFDPQDPGAGLWESSDGTFLAAVMDGSVHRSLRKNASAEMLLGLFQTSDGKSIDWDALR